MGGLWLMRQAPGLYLALITAHAALNYYAGPTSNWLLLGIMVSFIFYYWNINLAAYQVSGRGGGMLDFLKPRNAPLLGTILYVLFAMLWAMLFSIPVVILGALASASIVAGHMDGEQLDVENQEQAFEAMGTAMAQALASGPLLWVMAGMMAVTFVFYIRFLSNRVTVPVIAAIYDTEIEPADTHAGPRSGRRFPTLFWIFALTTLPMWLLSMFLVRIIPPGSSIFLIYDLALSFATALPFVATVVYVDREVGPPAT